MRKTVMITGTNRGLGLELLRLYHSNGYITFPLFRDGAFLEEIENEFKDNCYPIVADIGDDSCINKIIQVLKNTNYKLDILINNASVVNKSLKLDDLDFDQIQNSLNINTLGAIRVSKAVKDFMISGYKPVIINISSRFASLTKFANGDFGNLKVSYGYRLSKACLNMATITMNDELIDYGIGVVSIHPGRIKTRMAHKDADLTPEEASCNIKEWIDNLTPEKYGKFFYPTENEEYQW